ncbi:hypothetical protein LDENG_00150460, partial [Lucifuga dentata]
QKIYIGDKCLIIQVGRCYDPGSYCVVCFVLLIAKLFLSRACCTLCGSVCMCARPFMKHVHACVSVRVSVHVGVVC